MEDRILHYLSERDWRLEHTPSGLYRMLYKGHNTNLIVHLNLFNVSRSIVIAESYYPEKVPQTELDEMAERLNALNLDTLVGHFFLMCENGEIGFRSSVFFFNAELQLPMVYNCLDVAAVTADQRYAEIFGRK